MADGGAEGTIGEPAEIDLRGLKCPLPVLKLAKRLERYPRGATVVAITTDPMAAIDVPHFCGEKGHTLVSTSREAAEMRFTIEKG